MVSIDAPGNAQWSVSSYGSELQWNKGKLAKACEDACLSRELHMLLLAMGFQETAHLTVNERDTSKDYDGDAANVTLFNLSIDLVKQAGFCGNPWDLNHDDQMHTVVSLIRDGINQWGVNSFLNFVRGGRTAWQDGTSYGAADYRNSIKTMYNVIAGDQSLLWDDRRVNINLQHV